MSNNSFISSKDHSKKFSHFSALVFISQIDGKICDNEQILLQTFAVKLGIDTHEYQMIIENPSKYPVEKTNDVPKRLRRLFEMFQLIFADNIIDDNERKMVYQYAIELGFPPSKATFVIDKSIDLFTAKFNFKEYSDFVTNQV